MLLQFDYTSITWIIGLGLMFVLAFAINYLLEGNFKTFFLMLLIFDGFMVWTGFLELWTIILTLIVCFAIIFYDIAQKRGVV